MYLDVINDRFRLSDGRFRTDGHHQVVVAIFIESDFSRLDRYSRPATAGRVNHK